MDILAKLKTSRSVVKTVEVGEVSIGLRILTEQDRLEAGWAAVAMLDKHETELTIANSDLFEAEKAIQLLQRFVVDPDTGKPVFPNADEVRTTLSREERNAIGDAYYDFEQEYSPSERTMSEAEFSALLDDIKKKPADQRLSGLSGATLRRLVLSLAAQPTT